MASCNTPVRSTCWRATAGRAPACSRTAATRCRYTSPAVSASAARNPTPACSARSRASPTTRSSRTAISSCPIVPASASKARPRSTASCATSPRSAPGGSLLRSRMQKTRKPTWKELLDREQPLLLPCAHDALSARLIERAGFTAYSIGGFALVGSRYGIPDIGLAAYGEISAGIRDIMAATRLPVLVDCDTGYGDVKNVTHTVQGYEAMGASAIFIEDQVAPKRCGHMAGKDVVPAEQMVAKIRAAASAR